MNKEYQEAREAIASKVFGWCPSGNVSLRIADTILSISGKDWRLAVVRDTKELLVEEIKEGAHDAQC